MRKWLSGGVSPCQGEGRGFESRLVLLSIFYPVEFSTGFLFSFIVKGKPLAYAPPSVAVEPREGGII